MTLRDALQIMFFVAFVKPFVTLFIGLRVRGREHLPLRDPFVLIANHSSHLDTISLLSLLPLRRLRRVQPVAAADYFNRNRMVSWFSRTLFNILPIPRQNITAENHPLDLMEKALQRGQSLIIFPEGTRGSGEDPGKFRTGVARLVERKPEVPVVPCYLVNMGRSLPKGEWIPVPFFAEVRIGKALHLAGEHHQMTAELEKAVAGLKSREPDQRAD